MSGPQIVALVTGGFMVAGLLVSLGAGILLARQLGDSARGAFALVSTWFGLSAMLAEWGQSSAATYLVAKDPRDRRSVVASSRLVMLGPSSVVALVGVALSQQLSEGDPALTAAYSIAFCIPIATALTGAFLFAAQATAIWQWNALRFIQPCSFLVLLLTCSAAGRMSVLYATLCLAGSVVIQSFLSWRFGVRAALVGGRAKRDDSRWLGRFGFKQLGWSLPASAMSSADKIVLGFYATTAVVGHYAVALTVMGVSGTLAGAISVVAFPRLAAMPLSEPRRVRIEGQLLCAAGLTTVTLGVLLAAMAPWALPLVYGSDFSASVGLTWWLLPAALVTSLTLVAGTIVRGRGLPGRAALAQILGLGVTVVMLLALVPNHGVVAAALAVAAGGCATVAALVLIWAGAVRSTRPRVRELPGDPRTPDIGAAGLD